jgi:hypothetical protein
MDSTGRKAASRILERRDNVVAVDFRPQTQPPEPRFPGGAALREPMAA